jgi:hypothetical protein
MTWVSNLSLSISTLVLFFYLSIILVNLICDGSYQEGSFNFRSWDKEKYYFIIMFMLWLMLNIWQWMVLK